MSNEEKKRSRSTNYTLHEKEVLLNIAEKYKNIIENKKTDGVTMQEKNKAWEKITSEFNSLSPNMCYRTADSLHKYYENQKRDLKKKIGEEKKQLYLTGGGLPPSQVKDPSDEILINIVNKKVLYGITNPFDCDTVSTRDVNVENINNNIEFAYEEEESSTINLSGKEKENRPLLKRKAPEQYVVLDMHSPSTSSNNGQSNWTKYKPSDLSQPISSVLKRHNETTHTPTQSKLNASRRRPTSTIRKLSSSTLAEKYELLVDKRLELIDSLKRESLLRLESHKEEHELKIKLLEIDLELKKQQLQSSRNNEAIDFL